METVNVQATDASSFFSNLLKENPDLSNEANQNPEGAGASGNEGNPKLQNSGDPAKTAEDIEKERLEKEKGESAVQSALNKSEKDDTPTEISDYKQLAEKLIEDKILIGFEDGAKVENPEEFVDLLQGNIEFKVEEAIKERWEQEIGSLSNDAKTIIAYAKGGITDARDFAQLINKLAAKNEVFSFDPSKETDQEQIVKLQLLNAGLSEAAAKETVEDLKASKKLEARAKELFPSMKKAYEAQVQQSFKAKEQEQQERDSYVVNNATNVQHFLQNEEKYLPFKIKDTNYKSLVYELAAKPVALAENGDIIYGWQNYLNSLQNGTEENYKEFMKIVTYMANTKGYDEAISKLVANDVNKGNFERKKNSDSTKKLAIGNKEINTDTQGFRKKVGNPWSV